MPKVAVIVVDGEEQTWQVASREELKNDHLVKLVDPEARGYKITKSNPAVGSQWECTGRVIKSSHSGTLRVAWDNGTQNSYGDYTLGIVGPPRTSKSIARAEGNCRSIWPLPSHASKSRISKIARRVMKKEVPDIF
jgi:hypothetical protein